MKKFIFFLSLLCLLFSSSPIFAQDYIIEGVAKDFFAPNANRAVNYIDDIGYTQTVGIGPDKGVQIQFNEFPAFIDENSKVEVRLSDYNNDTGHGSYYYLRCSNTGYVYGLNEGATRIFITFRKNDGNTYSVQPLFYIVNNINPGSFDTLKASKDSFRTAYNTYILPMTDMSTTEALKIKNTSEDVNDSYTAFTSTGEKKLLNFYNFIRTSAGLNPVVWNNINHSKIQKGANYLGTTGKRGHNAADSLGSQSDEYFALHNSNLYYGSKEYFTGYNAALSFLQEGFGNVSAFEGHRTTLMKEDLDWIDVATNNGDVVWHYDHNGISNTKVQAYPFIGDFPIEFLGISQAVPWSITFPTNYNNLMGSIKKIIVVDKTSGKQTELSKTTSTNSLFGYDWFYQPGDVRTISFYPYTLLKEQGCFKSISSEAYLPIIDHTFEITLIGEKNNFTYETSFFSMTRENFKNITVKDLTIDFIATTENGIKEKQTVYLDKIANLSLKTTPEVSGIYPERIIEDPSIIKFDSDPGGWNFITGLKEGETKVTFKALGKEKSITVKVVDPNKVEEPVETPEIKDPSEDSNNNSSQKPAEDSNTSTNSDKIPVYRLYHPGTGEHLYTTDKNEVYTLVKSGTWNNEGIGWNSPTKGEAVYRLYSPVTRAHLFTTDLNEVNTLAKSGWSVDNNRQPLFYSGGSTPIYRLYNEGIRMHLITTDLNEYKILPSHGWKQEGVKLNAL